MTTETLKSANDDQGGPPPGLRPDTSTMTDRQLANAILAAGLRPRVGEIRRLAEAVLSTAGDKKKRKAKEGKTRKLAKIPGQAKKKKKKD